MGDATAVRGTMGARGTATTLAEGRWGTFALRSYLTLVFLATMALGWRRLAARTDEWLFGWLITYDAGFVRRGLTGEIVRTLSDASQLDPLQVVWVVQVIGYALFLGACWMMFERLHPRARVWFLPMILSPWLLAFQVHDPVGAFRKDTFMLALLAATAAGAAVHGRRSAWPLVAWVPLVLMHEMMVVFLPYAMLFAPRKRSSWIAAAAVVAAAGVAAAGRATIGQVAELCAQIDPAGVSDCASRGAVAVLADDVGTAVSLMLERLDLLGPTILPAILLVAVGMVPAIRAVRRHVSVGEWRAGIMAAVVSVGMMVPVAVVATDWGRFVYLQAACMSVVLLAALVDRDVDLHAPKWWLWPAIGVYAIGWHLQHFDVLVQPGMW